MRIVFPLVALALLVVSPVATALTEPVFRVFRPWLVCNDMVNVCYFLVCQASRCVKVWFDLSHTYPKVGTCVSVTESPTSVWVGVGQSTSAGDCPYGVRVPPEEVEHLLP